jgi:hypothetical protein
MSSVALTITLPTTRSDGSAAALTDIASVTILRDPGTGPVPLTTLAGPFTSPTVTYTDASPATGSDAYSAFCTDMQSPPVQGATSAPVSVSIVAALAPLSAPTVTAVVGP